MIDDLVFWYLVVTGLSFGLCLAWWDVKLRRAHAELHEWRTLAAQRFVADADAAIKQAEAWR